jgi:hypothetical protein
MDFTFGIITDGTSDHFIEQIILSIERNLIPNYEIIIVGNSKIPPTDKILIIPFNENIFKGWITRKKNTIACSAKYDNIVMMHDYIILDDNWYDGFLKFGNDYDWCVTKIVNTNGTRFRYYLLYPQCTEENMPDVIEYSAVNNIDTYFIYHGLFPYDFKNTIKTNKYMYISGAYYVIKKHIAMIHMLNESIFHGGGEDIEYSRRLGKLGIFIKCNANSTVHLLRYKEPARFENLISQEYLNKYIEHCNSL